MEIKYNIEKSQRKELAQKIAELTGAEVKYLCVPSCAYEIDFFTLDKNAVLSFSDRSDTEIVETVLNGLSEAGYDSETVTPSEGPETVTPGPENIYVEYDAEMIADTEEENQPEETSSDDEQLAARIIFPLEQHTVQSLINLICMIHSRGALISKATGGNFFADKALMSSPRSPAVRKHISEPTMMPTR